MVLGLAVLSLGCDSRDEAPVRPKVLEPRTPAEDIAGTKCRDVGDVRACWGEACPVGACLVERRVPPLAAPSEFGWRCVGEGSERECADRSRGVGAFECRDGECVQTHLRFPDDGEWMCADMAGATVCLGADPPAGVAPAAADSGWLCGVRKVDAGPSELCIDFSPDFPGGASTGWRCRYELEGVAKRICKRDPSVHQLADVCSAQQPCVDGAVCVDGRCLPPLPTPECWLDADCASGACRFGSCRRAEP